MEDLTNIELQQGPYTLVLKDRRGNVVDQWEIDKEPEHAVVDIPTSAEILLAVVAWDDEHYTPSWQQKEACNA